MEGFTILYVSRAVVKIYQHISYALLAEDFNL